ncbi:MAG: oligosaccharide flippase family protein [bacterium]
MTLLTGTVIAKLIPLLFSPFLTRIFSPEDFGIYGLMYSFTTVLTVVICGRYESSILLPEKDEDADSLLILGFLIAFVVLFVLIFSVSFFSDNIAQMINSREFSRYLPALPWIVFITGVTSLFAYWFNRKAQYGTITVKRITESVASFSSQLIFGLVGFLSWGLIFGRIVGVSVSFLYFSFKYFKTVKTGITFNIKKMLDNAVRYRRFPLYLVPGHLLNTISMQIPVFLFASFFSSSVVGFYTFTYRIAYTPMSVIGKSIETVFRQRAAEQYNQKGHFHDLFKSVFLRLFSFSVVPFVIFAFSAPFLFSVFFGDEWREAGEYAKILSVMFFFQFITTPLTATFVILERQDLELYWQIFRFVAAVGSIFTGYYITGDAGATLWFFSIFFSLIYLTALIVTYMLSKEKQKKGEKL